MLRKRNNFHFITSNGMGLRYARLFNSKIYELYYTFINKYVEEYTYTKSGKITYSPPSTTTITTTTPPTASDSIVMTYTDGTVSSDVNSISDVISDCKSSYPHSHTTLEGFYQEYLELQEQEANKKDKLFDLYVSDENNLKILKSYYENEVKEYLEEQNSYKPNNELHSIPKDPQRLLKALKSGTILRGNNCLFIPKFTRFNKYGPGSVEDVIDIAQTSYVREAFYTDNKHNIILLY